jgi:hypothetical protein
MAKLRIMYWKEIPVQVQATDGSGTIKRALDDRFQVGVDAIAMFDGSQGTDAYLEGWSWGRPVEVEGSAEDVVARTTARFDEKFPRDFVARVRKLHDSGERDPAPGAVDHWLDQ